MPRRCKQPGCTLASDRTPQTGAYCQECGYALKSDTGRLRKVIMATLLLGLGLAAWRYWPPPAGSTSSTDLPPVVPPVVPPVDPPPPGPPPDLSSLFTRAEELADAIPYPSGLTTNQLAEALARTGTPEEIRDPKLIAAVVYRWVARNLPYDVASLNPTSRAPQDPDQVLRLRKAVCEGYACLCESLLNHLQVEARILHGLARIGEDCIGRRLNQKNDGHAWLAVKWNNQWRLLEPTWGAGQVSSGRFKPSFTWDWFDTNPAIFIYTHIPEQAEMQLITPPLSQNEIENAARVAHEFFRCFDISPAPLIPGTLTTLPPHWPLKSGHNLSAHAIPLKSGVTHKAQIARFPRGGAEIRFPSLPPGDYRLTLFASPAGARSLVSCASYLLKQSQTAPAAKLPVFSKTYYDLNAQLHEPTQDTLPAGSWQHFSLEAPPGHTFGLQWEGETTILYLTATPEKTRYEKRILLRPGKLRLWKVEKGRMWKLVEFESR